MIHNHCPQCPSFPCIAVLHDVPHHFKAIELVHECMMRKQNSKKLADRLSLEEAMLDSPVLRGMAHLITKILSIARISKLILQPGPLPRVRAPHFGRQCPRQDHKKEGYTLQESTESWRGSLAQRKLQFSTKRVFNAFDIGVDKKQKLERVQQFFKRGKLKQSKASR